MIIEGINIVKLKTSDLIEFLLKKKIKHITKADFKKLLKELANNIEIGKFNYSLNILTLVLFVNSSSTIEFIRQKGIFRYSKYKGKKCIIDKLISEVLLVNNKLFKLADNDLKYLQSIYNFSNSHNIYTIVDKFILEEVKRFELYHKGESILKTLLTLADFLFLSNHIEKSKTNLLSLECRSKEDISMAISYLIFFISERKPLNLKDTNKTSIAYINSAEIQKMIGFVCSVQDFKEFEVLIDHFNYSCIEYEDKLRLIAPSKDFEKSIRIGYIKSDLQSFNDIIQSNILNDRELLSLEDLVEELYSIEDFEIFQYTESNDFPRYRLVLPEPVLDFFIEKYFTQDFLFKDEILYLSHINKEQLLDTKRLESIIIKDNLTLFDIIKFRRFFSFFYQLFTKKIFELKNIETEILMRSLIPAFKEEVFYDYLERFSTPDKVDSFLDIICWEPKLDIIFDLQYHPVLFINQFFLTSLSIFNQSNFIRNLYASEYKKQNKQLFADGVVDVLVNELSESFSKSTIENYCQTPIPNSDIDLVAINDDTLYVFECKHTLQPVSSYDLRTTYDYIKKAEKQLDNVVDLYNQEALLPILEKKWNLKLSNIKKLVCCIVLSNRLLNGNSFKYPVRYINEIKNIIDKGLMKTEKGSFKLWEGDTLTNSDLIEYFSLNSRLVELLFDSVTEEVLVYDLMQPQLEVETYYMDMEYASKKLDEFTSSLKKVDIE